MEEEGGSGERGKWARWSEYLVSMLGYLVGLGNVWRFPYICYTHGGAAFLIPYLVAMVVCGAPLFLLETTVCQYSSLGPAKMWVVCPLFRGIGYGMFILTLVIMVYYNIIIAWAVYYLLMSFRHPLPWTTCHNWWNTPSCVSAGLQEHPEDRDHPDPPDPARNFTGILFGIPDLNPPDLPPDPAGNFTGILSGIPLVASTTTNGTNNRSSVNFTESFAKAESSVEQFWSYHVMQDRGHSISDLGDIRWQLMLCLLFAWVVVFFCLFKDIKTSGKVAYVAAIVPYFTLLALLIRGCLLPGAVDGVLFFVRPKWSRLLDWQVWIAGSSQVFYSIGIGGGNMATLASFNRFHNNVLRDALLLPALDALTSVFAGFVIFVYLGYMAHVQNTTVDSVVTEGTGLAFIAYPDAFASMPLPQLWAVLFFLVLVIVGMDSQFVHVQTISCAIVDTWPRELTRRKRWLTLSICILGFVLGLPFVTQGGHYVLKLCDWYGATVSMMLLAVGENLVLAWVYGSDKLYEDIALMIGYRPGPVWHVLWRFVTPAFAIVTWTLGMMEWRPLDGYPEWTIGVGWVIAIMPLLPIPIAAVLQVVVSAGTVKERIVASTTPTARWRRAISPDTDQGEGQTLTMVDVSNVQEKT